MRYDITEPKQHGIRRGDIQWQDDFSASIDNDGKISVSHSFICHLDEVLRLVPRGADSHCVEPGWERIYFDSLSVENIDGKLAKVICKFEGADSGDHGFDNAEDGASITLSTSAIDTPLEMHPRYAFIFFGADNSAGDLSTVAEAILGLKNGRCKLARKGDETYIVYRDTNNAIKQFKIEKGTPQYELSSFFIAGIQTYLASHVRLERSYTDTEPYPANKLNYVGHIVSDIALPRGYRVSSNRNWLLSEVNVEEIGRDYRIREVFLLSEIGGWIKELYEKK